MVASPRRPAPPDYSDSALDPDLLVEIANLRARGQSWEETAKAVQWDAAELCRVIRRDTAYPKALEAAEEEVYREAQADGLARLRALTHSANEELARDAASTILKYLAEKRRDETRLEVERIRSETRLACADAKARKAAERVQKEDADDVYMTPEEERQVVEINMQVQARNAERLARERAVVYLYGGCHKIGDTPPDETDTPMILFGDMTAFAGRTIYWLMTEPWPVSDVRTGPFLPPPGCRPRTCLDLTTTAPPG